MNKKRLKKMTLEEFRLHLKDATREENTIREAQKRRPMVNGDRLQRSTVLIDGKAHWVSTVLRKDGGIEVWLKRYIDHDDTIYDSTHHGFTLVTMLEVR
jgi:hypothetical protein